MIILKKIALVVGLLLTALIVLGYLPKDISHRLSRALVVLFVLGFALRVGAYLLDHA